MSVYTIDSNILIFMQRELPRDVFPGLWEALEDLAADLAACVCQSVVDEVDRGTDGLAAWAKKTTGLVCPHDASEVPLVQEISDAHPDWVQDTKNEADPWVIAHADHESATVVTQESLAGPNVTDKNQKIPNVAAEFGVPTTNLVGLARAEGWTFSR